MRGRFPVGAWNPRSGPHHSSTIREERPDQSLADPANGESVSRCRTCGLPEDGRELFRFRAVVGIGGVGYAVVYGVCLDCILRSDPRPIADPLEVV